MASSLSALIKAVQQAVKGIPELRKSLSVPSQRRFSTDICLAAYGIRTGYLVDLLSPDNPVDLFGRLINSLRTNSETKSHFANVVHLHEPLSDQSFFVNMKLLAHTIHSFLPDDGKPAEKSKINSHPRQVFIRFQTPFEIYNDVPSQVLGALSSLQSLLSYQVPPSTYSLPPDTTLEIAVPLAAILLDYPIAYVPPVSQDVTSLTNVPLDFYECLLTFGNEPDGQNTKCSIMKFSSPSGIAQDELRPERMVERLQQFFSSRLEDIRDPTLGVTVEHTSQLVEHVVV